MKGPHRQPSRILAAAGLALLTAVPPGAAQAGPSPLDLLARYGIRTIDPPSPATDFTLPDLAGTPRSLADFQGSWVVLTFFATWCGPCRMELPTLERLHQDRAMRGVVVLGVSVDGDRAPLDPFVRQLGLSFPILWDQSGTAARIYRAHSVPISYLIDPKGLLVGVSRGSRDWSALTPMVDALLDQVPATDEPADAAYATGDEPVALPAITDPPTAEVALETTTPRAGRPFYLDVHLRWAGNFDEYLPHPPVVELPEGVEQETVTASTSSRAGRNQLTYRITLRAEKPGSYALNPVELRYTPRFEATPLASRIEGPTVEVRPLAILGLGPLTWGLAGGGLVLVALLAWGIGRRRREYRKAPEAPENGSYERLHGKFEEARKMRMQGDGAGFMLALAELDQELRQRSGDEEPDPALRAAVERARYGGDVPPGEELDQLQRRLERQIEALRPDPAARARREVRLRDDESEKSTT